MISWYLFNNIVKELLPESLENIKEFVGILASVGRFIAWTIVFEKDKYKQILSDKLSKHGNNQ